MSGADITLVLPGYQAEVLRDILESHLHTQRRAVINARARAARDKKAHLNIAAEAEEERLHVLEKCVSLLGAAEGDAVRSTWLPGTI